ncbi:lysozyme inhibitor LprI family protein [Thalassospiraceae bacterium LMO-JJ14]|nr:lysozyme inhibitor LprI family protein [Thalassospiraceae bacterium LMO-JJ14]
MQQDTAVVRFLALAFLIYLFPVPSSAGENNSWLPYFAVSKSEEFACKYDGAPNKTDIRKCLVSQTTSIDAEIDELIKQLSAASEKSFKELPSSEPSIIGNPASALVQSQDAWRKFRKLNCGLYYDFSFGGSIRNRFHAACNLRIAKERRSELQAAAKLF